MMINQREQAAIAAGHPEWAELPAARKSALESGVPHYFTGKACKRGHVEPRRTSAHHCSACEREYQRSWMSAYGKTDSGKLRRRAYERTPTALQAARISAANRRASKLKATPRWLTAEKRAAIEAFYQEAAAHVVPHQVDHIIPLCHPLVSGLHVPWNLQVLSADDNLRKGNSFDGTHENESWRSGKEISS